MHSASIFRAPKSILLCIFMLQQPMTYADWRSYVPHWQWLSSKIPSKNDITKNLSKKNIATLVILGLIFGSLYVARREIKEEQLKRRILYNLDQLDKLYRNTYAISFTEKIGNVLSRFPRKPDEGYSAFVIAIGLGYTPSGAVQSAKDTLCTLLKREKNSIQKPDITSLAPYMSTHDKQAITDHLKALIESFKCPTSKAHPKALRTH